MNAAPDLLPRVAYIGSARSAALRIMLSLYRKLDEQVLSLDYERPAPWQEIMRRTIAANGSFFNSHRMVRRYLLEAYSR